jgi:hypothetical protein
LKKGLVKWLKVKALSSSSSATKKKKKGEKEFASQYEIFPCFELYTLKRNTF